jgi:hypothetical protein
MKRFTRVFLSVAILLAGAVLIPLMKLSAESLSDIWTKLDGYAFFDIQLDMEGSRLIRIQELSPYTLTLSNISTVEKSATGVKVVLVADPPVTWQTDETCEGLQASQASLDKLNAVEDTKAKMGVVYEILSNEYLTNEYQPSAGGLSNMLICDSGTLAQDASRTMTYHIEPHVKGVLKVTASVLCNETEYRLDNNTKNLSITVISGYRAFLPIVLK